MNSSELIVYVSNDLKEGQFSGSLWVTEPRLSPEGVFSCDQFMPIDDYIEVPKEQINSLGILPGQVKRYKLTPIDNSLNFI